MCVLNNYVCTYTQIQTGNGTKYVYVMVEKTKIYYKSLKKG